MPKVISATEAKNNFGTLASQAREEPVIVESHGKPILAVLAYDTYQNLLKFEQAQERLSALERLRAIRDRAEERTRDLSPEDAQAIADEIVGDTFSRMVDQGKIRFEE